VKFLTRNRYSIFALGGLLIVFLFMIDAHKNSRNQAFFPHESEQQLWDWDVMDFTSYKNITDSLRRITSHEKALLRANGQEITLGFIGARRVRECINCVEAPESSDLLADHYYLSLPGYYLKDGTRYGIERNSYFIVNPAWPRNELDQTGKKVTFVRFAFDPDNVYAPGAILLPLSQSKYQLLRAIFIAAAILLGIIFIYFVIFKPIQVLVSFSNGLAYAESTWRNLVRAGLLLIASGLIIPLGILLMSLFLKNKIPVHFQYPFLEGLLQYKLLWSLGLLVTLVGLALREGAKR
jgi:hypothetical protein